MLAVEIDRIHYKLDAETKEATITMCFLSGEIVIPESVTYEGTVYSVTGIGEQAFYGCFGLTSLTIPNSVTSIGVGAFLNCTKLTSVRITDIATWCEIKFASFESNPLVYAKHLYINGEEVKDLIIPNNVTNIGDYAFSYFRGLTSITIGNNVTDIGKNAFCGCSGLTSVTIGNSVTNIRESAFEHCSSLTSITIGNSVTNIGESAFSCCSGLTSITIPNSVTNIGEGAFYSCSSLTSISIPNSVSSIGDMTFSSCWNLTSVIIGNSVTSIGEGGFQDCPVLTSVIIGNSVTSIGASAFYGCSSLTSVTIPNSVTSIEYGAFKECSKLTFVHISDLAAWCKIKFKGENSNPLYYAHHLYLNGEEIKDLVIPNSVEKIRSYAFQGCSSLTSVTMHNNVTSIGEGAFSGCSGLTSVTIPNNVTNIEYRAFKDCTKLLDVYCHAENVPSTGSDAFMDSNIQNATLHVLSACVELYKAASPWNEFGKIVALTDEETGIENLKFGNATKASALFDLNGRRIQKAQKGLYIQNGHKVLVK